ncbi:MAG TPA: hypothetical protein VNA29_09340, partial [Sphingomicrobium sp.]|nr:hypothetical protein [Sphingomicrobium sp.]
QKIPSLEPIGGLRSLRALFATSVQLADKSLLPLAQCPALRFIGCARFAPRQSFEELRQARPDLVCGWFDEDRWKAVGGRAV